MSTLSGKVALVVLSLRFRAVMLNWLELRSALIIAPPMLPVAFRISLDNLLWLSNCVHGRQRTYSSDCYVLDGHGENLDYNVVKIQIRNLEIWKW